MRAAETSAGPVPTARLEAFAASEEKELRGDILPFWLAHSRDREHGGFHAYIGEDMKVHDDLPRGALLTSRVLWTFSAAYRRYKDPEYLEMARWAYRDLVDRFTDKTYGGLFWSARADGTPVDGHKQIYGQVFGIYGLAEYYRATGDAQALDRAKAIYALIEAHAHDAVNGGYFDTMTREWRRPRPGQDNLLGTPQESELPHPYPGGLHQPAAGLARPGLEAAGAGAHRADPRPYHRPQDPPPCPLHEGRLDTDRGPHVVRP